MKMATTTFSFVFIFFLVFPSAVISATLRVPQDYPTIQAAINAANHGDTVLVSPGTYVENIDFLGKAITLRSSDGPEVTTIDGSSPTDPNRASVVTFENGEGIDSVIEGFKITNGSGTLRDCTSYSGGGIYCYQSSPMITHNVIERNSTDRGGGIYCYSSSPTITNNTISGNSVGDTGGGIRCSYSSPEITNNTIEGNSSNDMGGGIYCWYSSTAITNNIATGNSARYGGGIYCWHSFPAVTDNNINGNSAEEMGGGICCWYSSPEITGNTISGNSAVYGGGGIYCDSSSPLVMNNTITGNSAYYGGGIHSSPFSSPAITSNTISENSADYAGAGIYCYSSSPAITSNTISGNWADYVGGGIYCDSSSPAITNNIIDGNSAHYSVGQFGGGGIACSNSSSPEIAGNTINGNSTVGKGGGIYCDSSSFPTVMNNTITWNSAHQQGGGIYCMDSSPTVTNNTINGNWAYQYGGGICCLVSSPTITSNTIDGNSACFGGGVYCYSYSSPPIINNTITGNSAEDSGGGIYSTSFCSPTLINNTIIGNSAYRLGGGIYCGSGWHSPITNTILRDNSALYAPEIYVISGSPMITYCDVKGGWPGEGNIDADPLFVDAQNADFHLRLGSPCKDAGTSSIVFIPDTDYEGDERIVDGDLDNIPVIDMGADEILPEISARFGTINAAGAFLANGLLVNGSAGDNRRVYTISTGKRVTITMNAPPGGPNPANFSLYEIWWEPGITDIALQPLGIGVSCMDMPLSNGRPSPPPLTIANTIGYKSILGSPLLPGVSPAPCTIFSAPTLPKGVYTFQGYILDNGSAGLGASLTNAIILKVE